jgi:hypothetical protein
LIFHLSLIASSRPGGIRNDTLPCMRRQSNIPTIQGSIPENKEM